MKAHGTRLILGLIMATVIPANEPVLHLHDKNKTDNQGFSALMEKPHRCGPPALVMMTGSLPYELWLPADGSRMHVALENEDAVAVFDTDERYEVARIPASRAPRAIVRLPGAAGSEENREPRGNQPVWVIRLTAAKGDAKSRRIVVRSVGLMDLLEEQVWGLTPGTCHRVIGRSLVTEKLMSGIESLFGTRF